jgi:hypothetical protein
MYISLIPQHVPHAPPIPQHVPHAPPISSLILIIRLLFGQKCAHKSRSYVLRNFLRSSVASPSKASVSSIAPFPFGPGASIASPRWAPVSSIASFPFGPCVFYCVIPVWPRCFYCVTPFGPGASIASSPLDPGVFYCVIPVMPRCLPRRPVHERSQRRASLNRRRQVS